MVLNDDIFAVIRVARHQVGVDNSAISNSSHLIQRFTVRVALERANVDSFVKPGKNHAFTRFYRVTNEAVLTAFPRRGLHAFVDALDILIKLRSTASKQSVIIRRQDQIQLNLRNAGAGRYDQNREPRNEQSHRESAVALPD